MRLVLGFTPTQVGIEPTAIVPVTVLVLPSITDTLLLPWLETYMRLVLGFTPTTLGPVPTGIVVTTTGAAAAIVTVTRVKASKTRLISPICPVKGRFRPGPSGSPLLV